MILTTSSFFAGMRITETMGIVRGDIVRGDIVRGDIVRGTAVRSRHLGKNILALLRNLVGGEIPEYTKMLAEAREEALDRMTSDAERRGANAVIDVRFSTSSITSGAAEILCFGTAVKPEPKTIGPAEAAAALTE